MQYLLSGSLDLYETLNANKILIDDKPNFHKDLRKDAHAQVVNTHAHFIASAGVYDSCAPIFAWIFINIGLMVNLYLMSISFKFH